MSKKLKAVKRAPRRTAAKPAPPKIRAQIETSLSQELSRLKTETDQVYRRYKRETDPVIAAPYMHNWMRLVAQMTSLAKIAPKADADAGNVLPVADVDATWTRAFQELKAALEAIPRRVSTNSLFATLDPVDVEEVIGAEVATTLLNLATANSFSKQKDADGSRPAPR